MANDSPTIREQLEVEFEGVPFRLGRRWYIVPALALGDIERLAPTLDKFFAINELDTSGVKVDSSLMVAFGEVIFCAVRMNYPDVEQKEIIRCINMRNMKSLLPIVVGSSTSVWTRSINDEGKPQPLVEPVQA